MLIIFNASPSASQSQAPDLHLCVRQRPTSTVWDSAIRPIWRTIFSRLAQLEHRPEHRPEQPAVVAGRGTARVTSGNGFRRLTLGTHRNRVPMGENLGNGCRGYFSLALANGAIAATVASVGSSRAPYARDSGNGFRYLPRGHLPRRLERPLNHPPPFPPGSKSSAWYPTRWTFA